VQFTATPFREDGKHLQGRIIYAFPLREAQKDKYFSKIDYTSVIDFDNLDRAVAQQALERLRADLANDLDHVMMVRVGTIPRTQEVLPIYQDLAEDLNPVRMYSGMGVRAKKAAMKALKDGTCRVVVCVNMLGEGYDLPALKIAAVHDPQKSLGVTLQFIGRFARTSTDDRYGTASMFVARRDMDVDPRLRALYAEDADWNHILRDLTESTVDA
jgi:superfamily II DNA or RNA helicase